MNLSSKNLDEKMIMISKEVIIWKEKESLEKRGKSQVRTGS
jgi:hypothetical protein